MKLIKNGFIDENRNLIVNYIDEVGKQTTIAIKSSDFTTQEAITSTAFRALIQTRLDALSIIKAKIFNVMLLDGIFFIQGESYPPQSYKVVNLSTETLVTGTSLTQKQVCDNLYSFVLSATGNPLVSLSAPFSTNTVVINDVTMNYTTISTASGSILTNATQLVIDLFNQ